RWLVFFTRGPGAVAPSSTAGGRWLKAAGWLFFSAEGARNVISSLGSPLGWDGTVDWGFKARLAFLNGGLPPSYFTDLSREWSHLGYPWLVPMNEAWIYLL